MTSESQASSQGSDARPDSMAPTAAPDVGGLPTPLARGDAPSMPFKRNRPRIPGVDRENLLSMLAEETA